MHLGDTELAAKVHARLRDGIHVVAGQMVRTLPRTGIDVDFGLMLREFRLRNGWTQEELAERSGVSAHSICVLEAGRRRPRLSTVKQFLKALGLEGTERDCFIAAGVGEPGLALQTGSFTVWFDLENPAGTCVVKWSGIAAR